MIRLFWRFFIVFWLIQLLALAAIALSFQFSSEANANMHYRDAPWRQPPPPMLNSSLPGFSPAQMPKFKPPFWRHPLFHLGAIFLSSILFSAILARYVSAPIAKLKHGLDQVAANNWQTQLAEPLTNRRDEFGSLSRSFNQMAQNIDAAVNSQRRLLHDVSHELRSPLARLQILAGLAKQSADSAAYAAPRIEQETQKLETLVEEILTFSKLDSGITTVEAIMLSIADILSSICEDAQLEGREQHKQVILHIDGDEHTLKADPGLLYRALENVIRNAVKFTPPNTDVSVHLCQDDLQIKVLVTDHGPGVPPTQLPKLFSPFFKAHSTHSGIGLGLSIAKRAVEHCGGSIHAENRLVAQKIVGFAVCLAFPLAAEQSLTKSTMH